MADYNIDKARIYANGCLTAGAWLSFCLALCQTGAQRSGWFRLDPGWNWCPDHRPVPVIAFHGAADPIVPYNGGPSKLGGGNFPTFRTLYRVRRNQCGPNPTDASLSANVVRLEYTGWTIIKDAHTRARVPAFLSRRPAEFLSLRAAPRDDQIRVEDILGGLHHEYWLEDCVA